MTPDPVILLALTVQITILAAIFIAVVTKRR